MIFVVVTGLKTCSLFFFFKQKTAYEMRISDWSSDVCSSDLFLHHGDLTDSSSLIRIMQQTQPDEVYNLAAQSHVAVSFEQPEYKIGRASCRERVWQYV